MLAFVARYKMKIKEETEGENEKRKERKINGKAE